MILTDREIQVAFDTGQLFIDPPPDFAEALSSTSLDLTLSASIRIWKQEVQGVETVYSPATPGFSFDAVAKQMSEAREIKEEGFVFEPGAFLLAWTNETVRLPIASRLAARVEGKSSIARLGIGVHVTAPTIHAGFDGPIQLEMFNQGKRRVRLIPGMRVCQLIFEQTTGTPTKGYHGQFQNQNP